MTIMMIMDQHLNQNQNNTTKLIEATSTTISKIINNNNNLVIKQQQQQSRLLKNHHHHLSIVSLNHRTTKNCVSEFDNFNCNTSISPSLNSQNYQQATLNQQHSTYSIHHHNQHQPQQQSALVTTTAAAQAIITVVSPSPSSSSTSSSLQSSSAISIADRLSSIPTESLLLTKQQQQQQHPQSTEMISTQPVVTLVSTVGVDINQQQSYITVSANDHHHHPHHHQQQQQQSHQHHHHHNQQQQLHHLQQNVSTQQQQQQQQPPSTTTSQQQSQTSNNQLESDVNETNNNNNNAATQQIAEQSHQTHTTYEDYYTNGSNSVGQMATYYVSDSYVHGAYYTTDTYVVMDTSSAAAAAAAAAAATATTGTVIHNENPMTNQTHHHHHHQQQQPVPQHSTQSQTIQHPQASPSSSSSQSQTISNNGLMTHRDTIAIYTNEIDYNNKSSSITTSAATTTSCITSSSSSTPSSVAAAITPTSYQQQQPQQQQQQPARISIQPKTVDWLMENYETAEGVSLPRSTLYSHYQQHCKVAHIEPVNAASFGKLIRSVFVGLRTRRLGTRGNSKYHYYGIRIKPNSSLNDNYINNNGLIDANTNNNSIQPPVKRSKLNQQQQQQSSMKIHNNQTINNCINQQHQQQQQQQQQTINEHHLQDITITKEKLQSHLGDSTHLLDSVWPQQSQQESQQSSQQDPVQKSSNLFFKLYRQHYDRIIVALSELNFHEIEHIWLTFWQPSIVSDNLDCKDQQQQQSSLSLQTLQELTKTDISLWIAQTDYAMYNSIITKLLLPNLLREIPQLLTQQIRNFAKCINKWMLNALQGYSDEFIRLKTSAVSALSHMLRRYTSLNHLSTAACAVLKNQQQVQQMINDLNKVDFKNVQEQASWVCQCDENIVHQIESSFKAFLSDPCPYDKWSIWCEKILDMSLTNHNNNNSNNTITLAKQFFFKWEFYSSLVMRDLTLRSAHSFGSFHLIRLLFDEYIFYLVEKRIAKTTQTTALQMLGDLASNPLMRSSPAIVSSSSSSITTASSLPASTATTTTTASATIVATTISPTCSGQTKITNDNGDLCKQDTVTYDNDIVSQQQQQHQQQQQQMLQ